MTGWVSTRFGAAYPWVALGIMALLWSAEKFAQGHPWPGTYFFASAVANGWLASQAWKSHSKQGRAA